MFSASVIAALTHALFNFSATARIAGLKTSNEPFSLFRRKTKTNAVGKNPKPFVRFDTPELNVANRC